MPNRGFYLLYRHVRGKVLIALADGTVAIFRRKPGIVSSRVYFEALNFIFSISDNMVYENLAKFPRYFLHKYIK